MEEPEYIQQLLSRVWLGFGRWLLCKTQICAKVFMKLPQDREEFSRPLQISRELKMQKSSFLK